MDNNQFEWDIIRRKNGFLPSTLFPRLPVLLPFAMGVGYWIVIFSKQQVYFVPNEIMVTLLIIDIGFFGFINLIWYFIYRSLADRLIHYQVNADGITIDRKKIPLTALSAVTLNPFIESHALPYQQWKQPRPIDGVPLELTITTKQGGIKLLFSEEYVRQKFLQTLKDYLHPTSIS